MQSEGGRGRYEAMHHNAFLYSLCTSLELQIIILMSYVGANFDTHTKNKKSLCGTF